MDGNIKRLTVDQPADGALEQRRRTAAAAGILCAGVSLCTLASSVALESEPAMTAIGLAAFGLLLSALCFFVPQERVDARLVEFAPAAATLAVAVATTTIDPMYGFYLVLVAAFVAYTFRSPRLVGTHLALIGLALVAPIALEPDGTRKAVACALIFGPGVFLVSAAAIWVRRNAEAQERAYREFASDALELAARIRARVGPAAGTAVNGPDWVEAPAPVIPLRSVGIAKVVRAQPAETLAERPPIWRRLPVGPLAVAASAIVALVITGAAVRERDDTPAAAAASRAPLELTDARPAAEPRAASASRADRHHRDRVASSSAQPAGAAGTATAVPAASGPATAADDTGAGGSPHSASPAPAQPPPASVPVRPQSGSPQPEPASSPPVQQVAPADPVHSAVDAAQQTVGPLVPDLKP